MRWRGTSAVFVAFVALVHIEVDADILAALYRMPGLHRRKKPPLAERLEKDLVEPRVGGRLDELDID
ncbi:hypothetical protein R69927_05107 [Paraburkholderia domus]|jgi:hypothetical protein|uniref:Uncharacterized protein n=1 Tax=Paraburkholderia domus TaxID=2793075 RepID=A0A9N8N242_9BURK|nr:hypothetical protein R70006_01579 [Paraburkholderia domus]CAE6877534.1 hypothetical protein R75471_01576 [Paraburkholderia domus]CAE6896127.1 hypothetical protein R69927_05107 [Paraburkholderia domus]CAE6942001.1 hypothetical protein R70211_05751 [Paraburkholderia domus]